MPKLLIITTIQRTLRDFLLPYGDHFRSLGWQVDAMANVRDPYPVAANWSNGRNTTSFTSTRQWPRSSRALPCANCARQAQ